MSCKLNSWTLSTMKICLCTPDKFHYVNRFSVGIFIILIERKEKKTKQHKNVKKHVDFCSSEDKILAALKNTI